MSGFNTFFEKNAYRLLIIFYAIAYLLPISNRKLWIPDEARYAEISREMVSSGDWVVPHLLGLDYFEKPIAGYWLNSISQLLFGENHFSVRFASAFCTGLTGLLIFWFSQHIFQSRKKSFATTAIYLSFFLVYAVGTYSVLDAMVTLWLDLTLVSFYWSFQVDNSRQKLLGYAVMGVAAGLGFLTKGFISLVIPVMVALPYLVYRRKLSELKYLWVALLTFIVVSLPWAIAVHLQAPDFWNYFFWEEHVKRFAAEDAQHKAPFWYFLPIVIVGSLPWLGVIPAALRQTWSHTEWRRSIIFLLCWAIIPFLFFSIAKGKLPTYILPCFTPFAMLLGNGLVELIDKQQWHLLKINSWINVVFSGLVILVLILAGSGVIGRAPLYQASESYALILAVTAFFGWCLMGLLSLYSPARSIWFTALCPLAFGLLLGWSIPKLSIYSKLPEVFIHENYEKLNQSQFIFSSDPGVAVSLAWELKRTDIRLYDSHGEFAYGLKRSTQADKYLNPNDFVKWISTARREGNVSLVILHGLDESVDTLPKADEVITEQRLSLLYYKKQSQDHNE